MSPLGSRLEMEPAQHSKSVSHSTLVEALSGCWHGGAQNCATRPFKCGLRSPGANSWRRKRGATQVAVHTADLTLIQGLNGLCYLELWLPSSSQQGQDLATSHPAYR